MPKLTQQERSIFEYARKHLESERAILDSRLAHIHQQLGTKTTANASASASTEPAPEGKARKKRVMSTVTKAKMSAVMKKRWTDRKKYLPVPIFKTAKKAKKKAAQKAGKKTPEAI